MTGPDRVVLISGAGGGIGAATARAVAHGGARVFLGDLNAAGVADVAAGIGPAATGHPLDVTDEASWLGFVRACLERHGRIDGLVNNAGMATGHSLVETSAEEMTRVLAVNTVGPFLGIRSALEALRASGHGCVVNVSSCSGLVGLRGNIAYATSKFGVRGLTKSLVHELGGYGIRINSVFPGYIDTPMSRPDWTDYSSAGTRPANVALGRTGRPDEIGEVIRFLLSDASSYCTGTEFVVDGGLTSVLPARGDD